MSQNPPTGRISRTARLASLAAGQGARHAAGGAADRLRSEDQARLAQSARAAALADALVSQLGQMKGAAMKLGQVISTLDFPGLQPADQAHLKLRLAALRDQAAPQDWKATEAMLVKELGAPLSSLFADFDKQAFAAASIGQVHRAESLDGKQLAVKVQYKGIDRAVETDLRSASLLLPLLKRLAPGMDAKALLGEMRERVSEELDYELEASRTRQISRWMRGHPFLLVPSVETNLCSRRVLTTGFIEGQRFEDLKQESQPVKDAAAEQIFRFFFGVLTHKNTALGDPHPGNFLRVGDKMAFIDFGMQRKIEAKYLQQEREAANAVMAKDPQRLHAILSSLGYLPDPDSFDPELLLGQLQMAGSWYFTPGRLQITSQLVSDLMREASSSESPYLEAIRRQTIPPQALLIRRMESMLLPVLGELTASADWNALAQEFFAAGIPSNQFGEADQQFWLGAKN